jgi:transposase
VVEEIEAAGFNAHLAEPADTQAARGRKRRAKTDRTDARLLRDLLVAGEVPASWIPPDAVLEWRERVRLYLSLVHQRTVWCQRIHAEMYQHGVAVAEGAIRAEATRAMLADPDLELSPAARERIAVGYRMIDATEVESQPLKRRLQQFGTKQPACKALVEAQYGIGGLIAVAVWSELGDCRRFSRSEQAVRHTGLDVSVDSSDRRRAGGFLSRQGPKQPRTAHISAAPTTTTTRRSSSATTARSPRSPWPASSPDGATTCCAKSTPTRCTPSPTEHPLCSCWSRPLGTSTTTSGSTAVCSCHRRARQHPCWTAFKH